MQSAAPAETQIAARPNLVFILADDLGWSDTTLYGHTRLYETPNIERLAQRGMLFRSAYTAHPLCSPTRSSLMTGFDPSRTGMTSAAGNSKQVVLEAQLEPATGPFRKAVTPSSVTRLDTEYITLGETIRAAAYATGHFGKWHLGREPYTPLEHGFDVDVPHWWGAGPIGSYLAPWRFPEQLDFDASVPQEHLEDRMAEEAVAFIEAHQAQPFFVNYWAFSVHSPFTGKQARIEKYEAKIARLTEQEAAALGDQRNPVYAAMVESLDDAVGTLLDALDRLELSSNTIVVFYSDNGGNVYDLGDGMVATSNAPLRGGKATIYDGGTRVPCAVVWPGRIAPGSSTDALLSSSDWYPTLLEMMGIERPRELEFDGVSQVPVLLGGPAVRDSVVCFMPHYMASSKTVPSSSIRSGAWKLIRYYADLPGGANRTELFDLSADIGETNDVSDANPEVVGRLNAELDAYLAQQGAVVPVPNPAYGQESDDSSSAQGSPATADGAQPNQPKDVNQLFTERDANGDGVLSLQEFLSGQGIRTGRELAEEFRRMDVDRDDQLTLQEVANWRAKRK